MDNRATSTPEAASNSFEDLRLTILKDHHAIAIAAAQRIAARLKEKPDLVLGLATGATMEPVYAELARLHQTEGLDFSKARFFNLDAYEGIPSTDRNSYDNQLRKLLINKVNASPEHVHFVQGIGFDPKAYEAEIKAAGGIDIQLLGLGGEGHIGFNEIGSSLTSRTRRVELSARTREDNAMYFNKPGEKVPTHAFTMGIGTILEAKEILALANNPNKAWTVRNLMEPTGKSSQDHTSLELYHLGKNGLNSADLEAFLAAQQRGMRKDAQPIEELPARALHHHAHVTLLVDEEAASQVRPTHLSQRSNLKPEQIRGLLERFSPEEVTVHVAGHDRTLLLPPGFDFYDPKCMDINERFNAKNPAHLRALGQALEHTTDIGIGAHQDDVEIMAAPQLLKTAADSKRGWLTVIVTDGAASKSILTGTATTLTPQQLTDMRQHEQRLAAQAAGTPAIQLKYPSAVVNGHMGAGKRQEASYALAALLSSMPQLEYVYGHNPVDKHATHLGTLAVQTAALRAAKPPKLKKVLGMEVWGGLTGFPESMLEMGVVENGKDLAAIYDLVKFYESQIKGQGRDYAKTTVARIEGHGGYVSNPHLANPPAGIVIGLDLTEFTQGTSNDMGALARDLITRVADIKARFASHHPVPDAPDLTRGYRGMLTADRTPSGHERH